MKRTEQYRFDILISFFDRYVKIHRNDTYPDPSKDFGNATRGESSISIETSTNEIIRISGSMLWLGEIEIPIESIDDVTWPYRKGRPGPIRGQEHEPIDRLKIKAGDYFFIIDGLGDAVFTLKDFLHWAMNYG